MILDSNNFTSTIPDCFGFLTDLRQLYVFSNALTGTVPSNLAQLQKLTELGMENNNLGGSVPNEVCAIAKLADVWADCGGQTPEILCECCSTCCPSAECV